MNNILRDKKNRMQVFSNAGLYLVTSSELSNYPTLQVIEEVLQKGCRLFQLREKTLSKDDYKELAIRAKELAFKYNALFIVNDHVDVAVEVGADGVHLGQEDMNVHDARTLLGPECIIGVSTHNVEEILKAQSDGADYINVGPVFPTNTKPLATFLGVEGVKELLPYIKIPFTFMGGIKCDNVKELKPFKPAAVAMITEITKAKFPVDISPFLS